jgi:hypothetical protein
MNNKITSFRNFLGLFLLISMFSVSATAQTVILSEDFASATTGDNVETTGQPNLWAGNANFVVDATSRAYEAGGAIKLGTGSAIGYITSVPLDLSQDGGNFTITFDVKGWTTVEGNIKITVTGLPEQIITYTALRTSPAFENKTVTFTGGTANSTIRIETTAKRAFIDNVVVTTVPPTTIAAPVATGATNVDHDSFVAHWNAVTGADSYRLDVSTQADFSTFVSGYENLTVMGTDHTVVGLQSNTMYYYRIRAVDGDDTSANSNVIDATTDCAPFSLPDITSGEFCPASTVADLPLNGIEGYSWFANEVDVTPLATETALVHGTTYYLMQTINGCESERVPFVVNVVIVEPPVYAEPEVEACSGATIADITPVDSGYLFYTGPEGGVALEPTTFLVNGGIYYVSRTVNDCESTRTEITVELETPLVPVGEDVQEFTPGQTLADLVVTAEDELVWYADAEMTTVLEPTTPLVDEATYYAVNNDEGCMSAPLPVTVNAALGGSNFVMSGLVGYPNPVNNVFTVSYTETINSVIIYNMLGQVVMNVGSNESSVALDMSGFTAGAYFVKVTAGAESKTIQVVKQ